MKFRCFIDLIKRTIKNIAIRLLSYNTIIYIYIFYYNIYIGLIDFPAGI